MSDKEIDDILREIKENKKKAADYSTQNEEFGSTAEKEKQQHIENEKQFIVTESLQDNKEDSNETEKTQTDSEEVNTEQEQSHFDIMHSQNDNSCENENSSEESLQVNDVYFSEYPEEESEAYSNPKKQKIIAAVVSVVAVIAVAVGIYFGLFYDKTEEKEPTPVTVSATQSVKTEEKKILNPLTGEAGYNEDSLSQRPVAVVVENEYSTAAVKPQWGIAQADIVLEGESEFSTRMLMFWADYNQVPEQVGPTRSARPPFIRFSQLFDAVFIHAGLSHTAGGYIGADTVFENENVDHINLLSLSENGDYFARDYSRTKVVEHTGYLNGKNVAKLLEEKKIDTTLNDDKFTSFTFNDTAKKLSATNAVNVSFKWSKNCPKTAKYTYDTSKRKYTTTDFDSKFGKSQVEFENLILLLDTTRYVVKENYKGSGNSETYCNYELTGGKGLVCSEGTAVEITWGVSDDKLWMKDSSGNEVNLNPGKSYIGYGSVNNGGFYSLDDTSSAQN